MASKKVALSSEGRKCDFFARHNDTNTNGRTGLTSLRSRQCTSKTGSRRPSPSMTLGGSAQTNRHATPPPAVPALHVSTYRAQRPELPHTLRSRQCTSKSGRRHRILLISPTGGRVGSQFLCGCEPIAHRSGILKRRGAIFFPGSYQFDSGPPDGTPRSSVVHSPGRAPSYPLAWLASLVIFTPRFYNIIASRHHTHAHTYMRRMRSVCNLHSKILQHHRIRLNKSSGVSFRDTFHGCEYAIWAKDSSNP